MGKESAAEMNLSHSPPVGELGIISAPSAHVEAPLPTLEPAPVGHATDVTLPTLEAPLPTREPAAVGHATDVTLPALGASGADNVTASAWMQERMAGQLKMAATTCVTTAAIAAVDGFRHRVVAMAEDKVLHGADQTATLIEGAVVPAMQDAAVAGVATGGTALVCATAAEAVVFQAGGKLATVGSKLGPAMTVVFASAGLGAALRSWVNGDTTERDFFKTFGRVGWGLGSGIGIVAVAGSAALGSVATPAAVALGVGVIALDLTGMTDAAIDAAVGCDARKVRVSLIKKYAAILDVQPQATNDEIREAYGVLRCLLDDAGSAEDCALVDVACTRLLLLRAEVDCNSCMD